MKLSHITFLFFVSCLFGSGFSDLYGASPKSSLEQKKQEIRARRYERLKNQHEANLQEISELRAELEKQNALLDEEINQLQELIQSQDMQIQELQGQITE